MYRDELKRIIASLAFAATLLLILGTAFGQSAPQPGPAPPTTGQTATIQVVGCWGSVVSFDGYTSWQVGNVRTLTTPPLTEAGHYKVTATGPAHTISGDVTVEPGKTTTVTLNWTSDTLTFAVAARAAFLPAVYYGGSGGCSSGRCR